MKERTASSRMKTGLLRKQQGNLLPTPRGRTIRNDPVALWWHLAENVPPRWAQRLELQATVLLLTAVVGRLPDDPLQFAADWLTRFGYRMNDGSPVTKWSVRDCAETAWTVLRTWPGSER
ncbi:MAG TPA: hypothetical protein VKU39_02760 [Streptosporangiaceae bacterium]|nr:hypothetical protein [Streptosporangiaceae bacterium]